MFYCLNYVLRIKCSVIKVTMFPVWPSSICSDILLSLLSNTHSKRFSCRKNPKSVVYFMLYCKEYIACNSFSKKEQKAQTFRALHFNQNPD